MNSFSYRPSRNELIGILVCISAAIVFGLYPPAARAAYSDGANVAFIVILTTFCRMVGLYIYVQIKRHKIFQDFNDYKYTIIAGVCQALTVIGIFGASYFLPGAVVIIIMFTYSLMLLLFSAFRREIQLNLINVSATLLALFGLALVMNVFLSEGQYNIWGILLAFLAAFMTFARTYIYGKQSQKRDPIVVGLESFIVAFVAVLLTAIWQTPALPDTSYGISMAALCAIVSTIGTFGMFYGIYFLGAYQFSMIMKLEPIFTTIFGIVIVKDYLIANQYIGIVIVLLSLVALQLFDERNKVK